MMRVASATFHAMHLALLRGASWIVPLPRREDWYQEWTSELWHVRRSSDQAGAYSWAAERDLTAFCAGSFRDAACLRGHARALSVASATTHGSAWHCVLWLCGAVALCACMGRFLPGIESEREAAQSALAPGILLVQGESGGAAIRFPQFRDWASRQQRFFDRLAFYRLGTEQVQVPGVDTGNWQVAHASEDLPAILGATLPQQPEGGAPAVPRALVSRSMWRRDFQSNPDVVGQEITVAHRSVRIAGIAPASAWQLPGDADLWVMESNADLARGSQSGGGYVLAQLSPRGQSEMSGDEIDITAYSAEGEPVVYHGVRPAASTGGPLAIYLFALMLAGLALPAITSVFKSESAFDSHRPALKSRAKRFAFLTAKMALVCGLGYFSALDIAYWKFPDYAPTAEFLQFAFSFGICLFGLRWALVDQSRRCPVCLRRVTHPAQVGIASCTFLGWNGTEMICAGGHALLHVPSLPTSWFSRQRWMYLDGSWDFLFADTPRPL